MNTPTDVTVSSNNAPVCVLGMHRSGTSMVTGILSACGLWLGTQDRLMPAHPDNPDGYFENLDIVAVNEALLTHLGGTWDHPPALEESAFDSVHLTQLVSQMRSTVANIASVSGGNPWGWKDPRTCITLPFWQKLMPEMKTIVCLRNPVAVARSLHRRDGFSLCQGLALWQNYNQRIMGALTPGQFIVTHYDAWFNNPEGELRRLLEFLNWRVPDQIVREAASAVRTEHRRYEGATIASLHALGGDAPSRLYNEMRARAGSFYPAAAEESATPGDQVPIDTLEWAALSAKAEKAKVLEELLALEIQKNHDLAKHKGQITKRRSFYRLGDVIDFRRGGNAPLYTTHGWKAPSLKATRIKEATATLELFLVEPTTKAIKLCAKIRSTAPTIQEPVSIEVSANGNSIALWSPLEIQYKQYEALIPVTTSLSTLTIGFSVTVLSHQSNHTNDINPLLAVVRELKLTTIADGAP